MRIILIAAIASLAIGGVASAKDMKSCNADWKAAKGSTVLKHNAFISQCMKGDTSVSQTITTKDKGQPKTTTTTVAPTAAAPANAPTGATAQCKDGSYSKSAHHSGTCSHHGGVAKFLS